MTTDVLEELFQPKSTLNPPRKPTGRDVKEGEQDPQAIVDAITSIQTLPEDRAVFRRDRPPGLHLPGFGEPRDDCGVPNPATSYVCAKHGHAHQYNRNCLQYDCPMHWRHAVRRRAAGSADGAGVAPRLEALRKWLNYHREEHQRLHHLVVDIPNDINVYADDVLARLFAAVREIMDELGVQGVVAYHPYRHDKEDWEEDSLGDWPDILNMEDWDDARDELSFEPHFHIIGVAHEALDYSIVEEIQDEAGWVLHRIENSNEGNSVSIGNLFEMCQAVCYVLSHTGVYKTDQQRRLAAAFKGPDVNDVQVYTDTALEVEEVVGRAAIKTLGIEPTDLRCQEDVDPDEVRLGWDEGLPEFLRASEQRAHPAAGEPAPLSRPGGPTISPNYGGHDVYISGDLPSHHSGVGAMASAPSELGDRPVDDGFDSGGGGGDNVRADTQVYGDPADDDHEHVERTDVCRSKLLHISQASELLLSREQWRQGVDSDRLDHLDRLYKDYVRWLEREDLSDQEARPMVTEERHGPLELSDVDPPPSD